jgi:hypothetical protein
VAHDMKRFLFAILIGVLAVAACQWLPTRYRSGDALRRLTAEFQQLPQPPGAKLLAQTSYYSGGIGTMPQCAAQDLQALFGTSRSSLTEVLDYYSRALLQEGWSPTTEIVGLRGFTLGEEFSLSVTNRFGGTMLQRSAITRAEEQFETVYSVELMTPFELPYPDECQP